MISLIKRMLPAGFKRTVKGLRKKDNVEDLIASILPPTVCVDVGASYYPHGQWLVFLKSVNTSWIAVEPNEHNLGYAKNWTYRCKLSVCNTGLSQEGGEQVLYVTNVDSGSSLLEPVIPASGEHRVKKEYFFPFKKVPIQTITLLDVVKSERSNSPIFVKLDTQGTELSILKGSESLFSTHRVLGIEMESTMLAEPYMQGSGKFWQASEYLEKHGFELLQIKPIYSPSLLKGSGAKTKNFLNECDAVFVLRKDVVEKLGVEYKMCLFAFYITYSFYEEAFGFLSNDNDLINYLTSKGLSIKKIKSLLLSLI